jgi:hypothetical protein
MYYTNYIILRIKLFILSPIFPNILIIFVCIICWSLDSVILCDGETIDNLKNILSKDIHDYYKIMEDYEYYDDLRWEEVNKPERITSKINYLNKKASENIKSATDILIKIRQTEHDIQKIEPSFVSSIQRQWFEINLFNKKPFKWTP